MTFAPAPAWRARGWPAPARPPGRRLRAPGAARSAWCVPLALSALLVLCVAGATRAQAREIRVELEAAVPLQPPGESERAAAAPRSRALDAGFAEALRGVLRAWPAEEMQQQPAGAVPGMPPGLEPGIRPGVQPGAQPGIGPAAPRSAGGAGLSAPAGGEAAMATGGTAGEPGEPGETGEPGAPGAHASEQHEEAPDLLTMLPGNPRDYVLRYRVLEQIGERPAAPPDEASEGDLKPTRPYPGPEPLYYPGPEPRLYPTGTEPFADREAAGEGAAPALEFALRIEVVLDGDRIQRTLREAGFAPGAGEQARASLRIAVERPPSWRLLTRFRRALALAGAERAIPLELGPRRALLLVEGETQERLAAALAGAASSELSVEVLHSGAELVRVRLAEPAPEEPAPGEDPGENPGGTPGEDGPAAGAGADTGKRRRPAGIDTGP